MNYNFYADDNDKIEILNFIFNDTNLQVYDSDSFPEEPICEYKNTNQIISKFDLINGEKFAVNFQLWSPKHKGVPIFRKINLNPKYCNGKLYRYATNGYGLIQLYFGGIKNNNFYESHLGCFTEKKAFELMQTNPINGNANDWDWNEINNSSNRLKHYINNVLSTRKIGNIDVLSGADNLSCSDNEISFV